MTNPLRNYNIFYMQGDEETTDMDVVEQMGLDPDVAYTPAINDAAINKMEQQNIEGYVAQGIDLDKARRLASVHAQAAKASVRAAFSDQKEDFQF
jgi:hypothetical protein